MPFNIVIGRNESDRKKFGDKGTVFIGKNYVKMGQTTSLSNPVYLDVTKAHVIFIVGKRGGGKCVTGDTLITLEDGSQIPIKELKENNSKVYSLDKKLKIQSTEKSDFFKRKVKKIIKLKLRSGKEIELTPEHPLLTVKGWTPAQELDLKSRIAVPRNLNCFGKQEMPQNQIKLLAYLIAEGHTRKSWVLFSNSDPTLVKEFTDCVKEFDKELQISEHGKPGCYRVANKNNRYSFRENKLKTWVSSFGLHGKYAPEKWIPNEILKLPKEELAIFLNRLFSCDGSIYYDKNKKMWELSYSSSSKQLIKQVHHLILRYGILSKLRTKKVKYKGEYRTSYEIVINEENVRKFINEIGFLGKKRELQKQCLQETKEKTRNPNIDTIPKEIWELYRPNNWAEIGRAMDYAHPKAMRERIRYAPSRQTLLQIAQADNNQIIEQLATSDIFWDEIISMEVLEGEFEVFDISVPNTHNFVANDIIIHNSYSASVIAESMVDLEPEIAKNLAIIMIDTMGVFWSMKYANEKDQDLLELWNLKPKGLKKIEVYTPYGVFDEQKQKGVPVDHPFSIKASELTGEDWRLAFELPASHPVAILIEKILGDFADKRQYEFTLTEIVEAVKQDSTFDTNTKNEALNRLKVAKQWGLFSDKGTKIDELIQGGKVIILDTSAYITSNAGWGVRALVVGLVTRKIFIQRMISRQLEEVEAIKQGYSYFKTQSEEESKERKPLVWFIIDEAHNFLPFSGKTAATDALVTILREGRQPGLSLILITQQPGKIHTDVLTQSDIVISHRLTAARDVKALNSMMQSYLGDTLTGYINMLPSEPGAAIILDDNSERLYPMRIRPKLSWHGGEAPSAIKYKRELPFKI